MAFIEEGRVTITIVCQNISKSYGTPVLQGVSFSVPEGQIFGVIGKSGAGKSTLLRILGGLVAPDAGQVTILGQNLWQLPLTEKRHLLQRIGTVFQGYNLLSRGTVAENIALPLSFLNTPPKACMEKTRQLAEWVGLTAMIDRYPAQLSGGQRQRVAIARALATDAKILLCDELTSALDRETAFEILSVLQDLNQRLKVTIMLITHDMGVVREICDRVCVLDQGTVVELGDIESILLKPQHAVTRALLGHITTQELPQHWVEKMKSAPFPGAQAVVQILFAGDAAGRPIIAELVGAQQVPVNIVAGHMDHVRQTAFGNLIIALPLDRLETAMTYLKGCHVGIDVLGYVA